MTKRCVHCEEEIELPTVPRTELPKGKLKELRQRLADSRSKRKGIRTPSPPPYDDIYFDALRIMDMDEAAFRGEITMKGDAVGKYRKKPVVIEAIQLRWDTWSEMCEFAGVGLLSDGKPQGKLVDVQGCTTGSYTTVMGLAIPTLEGLMVAREGDWIIKGIKGELYPCKPDVFEATYEKVEEPR